jgi:acyl carrier protein
MEQRLFDVAAKILRVPIGIDSSPETVPSWDSLSHMNLVLALEDAFDVMFPEGDIAEMNDVRTILEKLKQLGVN